MSEGVSAEEFALVHQQLMETKLQLLELEDREKKVARDLEAEKTRVKLLEESLETETAQKTRLEAQVSKLNLAINAVKERKQVLDMLEENGRLRNRLTAAAEEFEMQSASLKRNLKAMFDENSKLHEKIKGMSSLASAHGALEEDIDRVLKAVAAPASEERKEIASSVKKIEAETGETKIENELLRKKIVELQSQIAGMQTDSDRMLAKLAEVQLNLQTVSTFGCTLLSNFSKSMQ